MFLSGRVRFDETGRLNYAEYQNNEPRPICFGGLFRSPTDTERENAGVADKQTALWVVSIEPGSVGERAGMCAGDLLIGFDGQPLPEVNTIDALRESVVPLKLRGGESRQVELLRNGVSVRKIVTW